MAAHDQTWPEVFEDLCQPELVRPDRNYPNRVRIMGKRFMGIGIPNPEQDEVILIGLRLRHEKADHVTPERQVVGRETKNGVKRSSGGSGSRWPSTVAAARKLIDATPGWSCEWSAKSARWHVLHNGQRVAVMPGNPGDSRALLNSFSQIKRAGLDLRQSG